MKSAVGAHDSPTYRKMDVARERISRIVELREILLSFQTGFNLVNAAVVCAILEITSGLEPSLVITVLPSRFLLPFHAPLNVVVHFKAVGRFYGPVRVSKLWVK